MHARAAPRVFLTGASSGLGRALALEWARRRPGVQLGLVARRAQVLHEVVDACRRQRAEPVAYAVDVNDRAALFAAADDFAGRGAVDFVVANAGISEGTDTAERGDAAAFERTVRTNLVAMFDTFSPFVAAMQSARAGTLVGIASIAGVRGMPGSGAYSASKAAAIAYLESTRIELAPSGVRVVTIVPGFVRTDMTARNAFRMPFLMEPDAFARAALDAIERGARYATIPWQMGVLAGLVRRLPRPLFDAAFARTPRKPRAGGA